MSRVFKSLSDKGNFRFYVAKDVDNVRNEDKLDSTEWETWFEKIGYKADNRPMKEKLA